MKQLTVMLKPASSLCNMRCKYCFYADVSSLRGISSYGIMTEATTKQILKHVFAELCAGDHLTLSFQGGEPTLAGLSFFETITSCVEQYRHVGVQVHYALQTNGLLLDDDWCRFLKKHHFLVGLSLDGPAEYHNANRVDAQQDGTFRRIMDAKQRMDEFGVEYNVLMVLTNQMARHPQQIWRFIQQQEIRYVQFIPCLGPLEGEDSAFSLTPKRYAGFYSALFDEWMKRYQSGAYISVKLFDDLVNLLAFGQCNACGLLGFCQPQLIVEADGSVYPCDFYVLDQYRTGNLATDSLQNIWNSQVRSDFLNRPREPQPLCSDCPFRSICNSGCQRMRSEVFYKPGDTICGHRLFLEHAIGPLQQLARSSQQAARQYRQNKA